MYIDKALVKTLKSLKYGWLKIESILSYIKSFVHSSKILEFFYSLGEYIQLCFKNNTLSSKHFKRSVINIKQK